MLDANSARSSSRSPFTVIQWQELEHQALIFKYMASGVPIPPELLYSVGRSLESSLASRLFPHQQPRNFGWGCFQVGFGRKVDPEPGRCRRTDGKKWRCSKEAYPDSKYCERHMHRGRNRSRKPVELITTSSSTSSNSSSYSTSTLKTTTTTTCMITSSRSSNTSSTLPMNPSSYSFSPLSCSSFEAPEIHGHSNNSTTPLLNPFLYPHSSSSSSRPPPASGFSPQNSTTHNLFMDSGSSSHHHPDKDYRYYQVMRENVDERAFFPEPASRHARTLQDSSSYQHLSMTMSSSYKGACYSQQPAHHFQSLADDTSKDQQQQQQQQQQHCFVLGNDFRSASSSSAPMTIKLEKDSETQKPLHHFFGGDWPPKNTDSWLDLASSSRLNSES